MLNSLPIPEYLAFNLLGESTDETEEDEEEYCSGPFVQEVRPHTAKRYFELLSTPWMTFEDDYTRKNAIEVLLREMRMQGLLSLTAVTALQQSGVLSDRLLFLGENNINDDCAALRVLFSQLAKES